MRSYQAEGVGKNEKMGETVILSEADRSGF